MKKKLVALLCAMVMALAIPATALAVGSPPDQQTANYPAAGVSATLVGSSYNINTLHVDLLDAGAATIDSAMSSSLSSSDLVIGIYNIYYSNEVTENFGTLTLTFNVGTQYNGHSAVIYQLHNGSLIVP